MMIHAMLDRLAAQPWLWGYLRWIVEDGFTGELETIERELSPRAGDGRRYLDFGCGTGEFARCFPADAYFGFDIARHYVQYAGKTRRRDFAVMDGAQLALGTARFDAALVCGVFHHMPDAAVRAAVVEIARVMRPNATFLVMEDIPSPRPWNIAGHMMHWLDRGDHIRTDADYRALLAPEFELVRNYPICSGICDLAVYVLRRAEVGARS